MKNSERRMLVAFLLSATFTTALAAAADEQVGGWERHAQVDPAGTPLVIKGAVEERVESDTAPSTEPEKSEQATLAPVNADASHNRDTLYGGISQNKAWFRIPNWLAGVWQTENKYLLAQINYRTGQQEAPHELNFGYCGEHYGWQQDKCGGYWEYTETNHAVTNYHLDEHNVEHFNIIDSYHPVRSTTTEFVLEKVWRAVTHNLRTGTENIRTCDSTMTFSLTAPDSIAVTEAVRTFDDRGALLSLKEVRTVRQKIAAFSALDQRQGENVKAAFQDYLSHGKI